MAKSTQIVMRSVLAMLVCALAWLCVSASLTLDRVHQDVIRISANAKDKDLPGFLWHHPSVLLAFAIIVALCSLAWLSFSKKQGRVIVISAIAITILLIQWLVVIPAVEQPAFDFFRSLERFVSPWEPCRLTQRWSQRRLRRSVSAAGFRLAGVTGGVAQLLVVMLQDAMNIFKLIHIWLGEHYSATTLKERLGLAKDRITILEKEAVELKAKIAFWQQQLKDCHSSLKQTKQELDNRKKMSQITPQSIPMNLNRPSRSRDWITHNHILADKDSIYTLSQPNTTLEPTATAPWVSTLKWSSIITISGGSHAPVAVAQLWIVRPPRGFMNMPAHTHRRTVIVKYQGHKVVMHILAYREIDEDFARSCFEDFARSQGRKKLKNDVELTFPTIYGA